MSRQLQFVHIGKCGGSTIFDLLSESIIVKQKYDSFFESHINGVHVSSDCDYLICLRNPIQRAFSAFEWRKKLVVVDRLKDQVNRFPGEREILNSYGDLGTLARSLYKSDGGLNQKVARDIKLIHHLRESISFYLMPLLEILSSENVLGVVCQETLASDCERVLGISPYNMRHRYNNSKGSISDDIDQFALRNLKRFFAQDYQCITAIWCKGIIDDRQYSSLLFSELDN